MPPQNDPGFGGLLKNLGQKALGSNFAQSFMAGLPYFALAPVAGKIAGSLAGGGRGGRLAATGNVANLFLNLGGEAIQNRRNQLAEAQKLSSLGTVGQAIGLPQIPPPLSQTTFQPAAIGPGGLPPLMSELPGRTELAPPAPLPQLSQQDIFRNLISALPATERGFASAADIFRQQGASDQAQRLKEQEFQNRMGILGAQSAARLAELEQRQALSAAESVEKRSLQRQEFEQKRELLGAKAAADLEIAKARSARATTRKPSWNEVAFNLMNEEQRARYLEAFSEGPRQPGDVFEGKLAGAQIGLAREFAEGRLKNIEENLQVYRDELPQYADMMDNPQTAAQIPVEALFDFVDRSASYRGGPLSDDERLQQAEIERQRMLSFIRQGHNILTKGISPAGRPSGQTAQPPSTVVSPPAAGVQPPGPVTMAPSQATQRPVTQEHIEDTARINRVTVDHVRKELAKRGIPFPPRQ